MIIGCGADNRGDDAAGLLVVRRLRELGVDAVEQTGDALSLLELMRDARDLVLVDAVVTGAASGTIFEWNGHHPPAGEDMFRCSTHCLGVTEAIELARALDCLPGRFRLVGIEGSAFDMGAPPSAAVLTAVERVARRFAAQVLQGA